MNHKSASALLAKVQDKLAAQPGECSTQYYDANIRALKKCSGRRVRGMTCMTS